MIKACMAEEGKLYYMFNDTPCLCLGVDPEMTVSDSMLAVWPERWMLFLTPSGIKSFSRRWMKPA